MGVLGAGRRAAVRGALVASLAGGALLAAGAAAQPGPPGLDGLFAQAGQGQWPDLLAQVPSSGGTAGCLPGLGKGTKTAPPPMCPAPWQEDTPKPSPPTYPLPSNHDDDPECNSLATTPLPMPPPPEGVVPTMVATGMVWCDRPVAKITMSIAFHHDIDWDTVRAARNGPDSNAMKRWNEQVEKNTTPSKVCLPTGGQPLTGCSTTVVAPVVPIGRPDQFFRYTAQTFGDVWTFDGKMLEVDSESSPPIRLNRFGRQPSQQ